MIKKFLVLGLVLVVGVLVLGGCGKSLADRAAERMIEKSVGGQVDVDLSDNSFKANVNGVNLEVGEGVSLPADFPSDVYVIEGKLISVMSNVEQKSYSVYLETDESAQAVYDQYNKELADDGWKVVNSGNFGGVMSLGTEKDGRILSVVASTDDKGKTTVSVSEYPKQ